MEFEGYKITRILHRRKAMEVARGVREADGLQVILKYAVPGGATLRELSRLRYEHKMLQRLQSAAVTHVPEAVQFVDGATTCLIMKDIGATSLAMLSGTARLEVAEVLSIGQQIAAALIGVHRAHVVHKDITASNIVYNPQTRAAQLIDFGIASTLTHELQVHDTLASIAGTLFYISPEQTGRINRLLDYRSDFYSLGVSLYEQLGGALPFEDTDLVELIHAILSRAPMPLHERVPGFSRQVSDLIDKLMAKSAEDRYQSAAGLQRDLRRCLDELQRLGKVEPFELGDFDHSERFQIPQKLYGRLQDTQQVQDSYKRILAGTCELVLITGPSGIGKSALVNELQSSILIHRGFFAAGKHDQLRRHLPFSAVGQAITGLIRRLLLQETSEVEQWRQRLQDALGSTAQVLIDVVPAVQQLLGPQPAVGSLAAEHAELRLLGTFARFIQTLCQTRPLVLFLDDLQWSDPGTLKLLKLLASEKHNGAGMLLIGAYRDNEVDGSHPLMAMLDTLRKDGHAPKTLTVAPLSVADVRALVADATHAADGPVSTLATLVHTKTQGNPFFVHEFLKHLWKRDLVRFDASAEAWTWDDGAVRLENVTDNVVALMAAQVKILPAESQRIIGIVACLGAEFSLSSLSAVQKTARGATARALQPILEAGMLMPLDRSYRYAEGLPEDQADSVDVTYKFVHDRIQQAAHDLLSADEAAAYHLAIGRGLMTKHAGEPVTAWVFEVVDHLNAAQTLLPSQSDALELANLNYVAGKESRRAVAYDIAMEYLQRTVQLTGTPTTPDQVRMVWDAEFELSECEKLTGKGAAALVRLERLLGLATTPLQKAEVHGRRAQVSSYLARWSDTVDAGLAGLALLDLKIDRHPSTGAVFVRFATVLRLARSQDLLQRLETPPIADERASKQLEILTGMLYAAYALNDMKLNAMVCLWPAQICMEKGTLPLSECAYALLCCLVAGVSVPPLGLPDFKLARQLVGLCRGLVARNPQGSMATYALMAPFAFAEWTGMTAQDLVAHLKSIALEGIQIGNDTYVAPARSEALHAAFRSSLAQGQEMMLENQQMLAMRGNPRTSSQLVAVRQTVRCLLGQTNGPLSFDDDQFNEDKDWPRSMESPYFGHKALAMFVHGDVDGAHALVERALDTEGASQVSTLCANLMHFISAVVLTTQARRLKQKRVSRPKALRTIRKRYGKITAAGSTCKGQLALLDAQLTAMAGDQAGALRQYEEAIALLEPAGYTFATAIAWECAARFALECGLQRVAQGFCAGALRAYQTWGATVKVPMLLAEWEAYLPTRAAQPTDEETLSDGQKRTTSSSTQVSQNSVDLPLVMRASQALSGEVVLDKLITSILKSMRESAGATRAVLLLQQNRDLVVAADSDTTSAILNLPLEKLAESALPKRVLDYVLRSGESVLLDDTTASEEFLADPYLTAQQHKSLLCLPIMQQGKCLGLIYLENNVMTRAFTTDRSEAVKLLASQAAISLQNAYLYTHLEEVVTERTKQLRVATERLLKLERENAEMQMAGGFAHEIRNALAGSQYMASYITSDPEITAPMERELPMMQALLQERQGQILDDATRDALLQGFANLQEYGELVHRSLLEVETSLARGQRITERVLNYAQLSRSGVHRDRVLVNEVLQKLMQEVAPALGKTDIVADVDMEPGLDVGMSEGHLIDIMRNLLDNARDALKSKPGGAPRRIVVRGTISGNEVTLSVADNGAGIPEHLQERLFEPFFSTKGALGTGLSLGVCKKLAELYGGRVSFEPKGQDGTTFRVQLPVASKGPP